MSVPAEKFAKKERRKEIIVNTKYDKCSDPMYRHLLFSTEIDVFLTAKRGKVWMERVCARNMAAKREKHDREMSALSSPVPVALQYLYGGSNVVQGEEYLAKQRSEEEASALRDLHIPEIIDKFDDNPVFPYNLHSDIHESRENDAEGNQETESKGEACRGRGRGGRRGRTRQSEETTNTYEQFSEEDYDVIKDDLSDPDIHKQFSDDHLFKHGTPNPEIPATNIPCGGCGAKLQCSGESIPGYIPSQLLAGKTTEELRTTLCQRCYIIKEYNIALKVSVSPEDYPKTIEHIKDKDALILLVVDLLDFPGSVWPNILDILGTNKKIILVGNKVDLIVPDQSKYIHNITQIIKAEFMKKCFSETEGKIFPKLISALCVSAKTGFNMETLIDKVFRYWRWNNESMPGDIYIIGCTNVGKSSIFNTLLESDLCKIRAIDLVGKAMTSPVPGTTLNLLKFPVTRPEPHFINDRVVRLGHQKSAFNLLELERIDNLKKYRNVMFATPSNFDITHTLKNSLKERQPQSGYFTDTEVTKDKPDLPAALDPQNQLFSYGKWCFDSPGTVSDDQIINLLTAEEISKTLASSPIRPRTMLLRVGHSLFMGGLGRLDYVEGPDLPPIRVTVFTTDQLPINIVETEGADEFYQNTNLSALKVVPEGGPTRMLKFPSLLGKEFSVTGVSERIGSKDIVLSSCGWVMVSSRREVVSRFIAYTPGGKGLCLRNPFLPNSVNHRGRRILGSPVYKNDRLFLNEIKF